VGGLTRTQLWKRVADAERRALTAGARFPEDTPAKRLKRQAEAVVFPERFNALYLPHYFRSAPAAFHLELYAALEGGSRIVVRAPRGHAKSTVVTFAYTLHQVACATVLKAWGDGSLARSAPELHAEISRLMDEEEERRRQVLYQELLTGGLSDSEARGTAWGPEEDLRPRLHWDPYVQVIASTIDQAQEFVEGIALELQENDLLRSDWGELWRKEERSLYDFIGATGTRVRAFGMEGDIRGGRHRAWRPTLAILDDPDSERTIASRKVRDRQERKLTAAVTYGLEPGKARVFVIGTPLHSDCLVCRLTDARRFPRWLKLRFKAIKDDGTPLWPERWSLEALQAEEAEDAESFGSEMMDRPPTEGSKPFPALLYYSRDVYRAEDAPRILAFDPSLGKTDKSDYQALVVLRGPMKDGKILVHRAELLRIANPAELVGRVLQVTEEERPTLKTVEAIGFQSLLEFMLTDEAGKAGLLDAGWITIEHQAQSKDLRIRGLAEPVRRGELLFPDDRSCRQLEDQFLDYPDGKRDGVDACEMAWRLVHQDADWGCTTSGSCG